MDSRPPSDPRDPREQTGGGRPVPVGGRGTPQPPPAHPSEQEQWADPETRVDLSGLRRLSEDPPPVKPEKPRRDGALPRMIAFAIAAVIFAAAPWYFFTRVLRDDKPSAQPAPTVAQTTSSPKTSPTPTVAGTPGTYEVVTAGDCLNVRRQPGTDQQKVTCVGNGSTVTSDGRLQTAGGMDWLYITYQNFKGWAAAQYLKKAG